jgi:hypothetical protein
MLVVRSSKAIDTEAGETGFLFLWGDTGKGKMEAKHPPFHRQNESAQHFGFLWPSGVTPAD